MSRTFSYDHKQWETQNDVIETADELIRGTNINQSVSTVKPRPKYKHILAVGIAYKNDIYTSNWLESMRKARIPSHILTINQKGKQTIIDACLTFIGEQKLGQKLGQKLEQGEKEQDERGQDKDDTIYVFTRVDNTLACNNHQNIIEYWSGMNKPILVCGKNSGEYPSKYWNNIERDIVDADGSGLETIPKNTKYVNSDIIAGTRGGLIHMFDSIYTTGCELSDSSVVEYMNEHYNMVKLDVGYALATMTYGISGNCGQFKSRGGGGSHGSGDSHSRSNNNRINSNSEMSPSRQVSKINNEYGECKLNEMYPCFISFENKHIDALQRYNSWGRRILRGRFQTDLNESSKPSVYWIIIIALIIAILLVFVIGFRVWLLAVIIVLILILIVSSKVATG